MKYRRFPEPPRLSCVVAWVALALALAGGVLLLLPLFAPSRGDGHRQSTCASNLKQLGLASLMYTEDYDGHLPAAAVPLVAGGPDVPWPGRLSPYFRNPQVLVCPPQRRGVGAVDDNGRDDHAWWLALEDLPPGSRPHDGRPLACGYLMNRELSPGGLGVRFDTIQDPAAVLLLCDGVWRDGDGSPLERQRVARAASRHRDGVWVVYTDGHAHWEQRRELGELRYAPGQPARTGGPR